MPLCPASFGSHRAFVSDAIACPACGRSVRLKLMGSKPRYVGIPPHTTPDVGITLQQRITNANATTNAAMTPKERLASARIVVALDSAAYARRQERAHMDMVREFAAMLKD